jgi:hypothetical protein
MPTTPDGLARWRDIWRDLSGLSSEDLAEVARRSNVSVRTLQRVRQAGEAGQLDKATTSGATISN